MRGAIPPLPQYALMTCCLIKHWNRIALGYGLDDLCFSTSNTKDKRIFRYRLSPETFGYTLKYSSE